ncbi:type III-B CRISPR module RAMP protein Cmr1 [Vibrio metschnikovii]|nr:type III-B CRISPR module RAMP protein Cmr1 [Vibrio metschnikovii]
MTQLQTWIDRLDNTTESSSLKADFQVVTPMFIGDGQQKADSIRPPAIKGALRFWWRALNWARCLNEAGNETEALNQLHTEEAALFGLAAKQDSSANLQGGQGVFSLRVTQNTKASKEWDPKSGTQYLLGQGLWHFKTKLQREFIDKSGLFCVELCFKSFRLQQVATKINLDSQAIKNTLDDALFAFGLLGGLGSRARRGLGAVSITGYQGSRWPVPQNVQDYKKALQELLKFTSSVSGLPPFTAFSANSRLDVSCQGRSAIELLEKVGNELQMYRSWGKDNNVNRKSAEKNFPDDHDQTLRATQDQQPGKAPQRAVFGLPHNYYFSSKESKVDIHVKKDAAGERRASPLIIHPHILADGNCVIVQLLLPAVFLPGNNPMLEYKSKRTFTLPVNNADWSVITRFMDRFKDKNTILDTQLQGGKLS